MNQTHLSVRALLFSGAFLLLASPGLQAGSATWNLNPISNDWNSPANWTPNTVPNGPADVATFGVSNQTSLSISATTEVSRLVFLPGASAYTITVPQLPPYLTISGAGIINSSGVTQNLQCHSGQGQLVFEKTAVVGDQVRLTAELGFGEAINFKDSTSAGNCEIVNRGSTLGSSPGGQTAFAGNASANGATITNAGGAGNGTTANGGSTRFIGFSNAGEAVITSEGAAVNASDGGRLDFFDFARAENAILIATGGSHGGGGAFMAFNDDSDGGTAQVQLLGNSTLSISSHHPAAPVTIGSLTGEGSVLLGARQLIIGSNNLSTTFSGTIQDTGSIIKIGTGTLTLAGANAYTRGTTVTAGVLLANNTIGSGTGTGAVTVNGGTLGGSGVISGAVTVGAGASLAPAAGTNKQVTLTLQSGLTIQAGATYTYTFKAKTNQTRTDLVKANGVTITGATITLKGKTKGTLTTGTVLTVISNTSATPISGTFSNLADGAIVTVNGNNLQASYHGGDGNDLTLTVVP